MIDTCQANTMYSKFYSPNILATGSSEFDQNSYSHEADYDIGVAVIDSYTHYVLQYLEGINKTSKTTMADFFAMYDPVRIRSNPGVRSDLFQRPVSSALVTDFFGGVAGVEVIDSDPFGEDRFPQGASESAPAFAPGIQRAKSELNTSARSGGHASRLPPARSKKAHNGGAWRVWAALGLVSALVGFAVFQSNIRTKSYTDTCGKK